MSNNVSVNITARDMTRGELERLRRNFRHLGQDMDRVVTQRTRQNWDRLREGIGATRRQLQALRGNIPDAEFFALDTRMRQAQRTMQRGFTRVGDRAFNRLQDRLRSVTEDFRDLDAAGAIRIRPEVDQAAIRRADARLREFHRHQEAMMRINARVETRRVDSRGIANLGRRLGALVGGTLSDGVGQGLANAFRSAGSNPVVSSALAAMLIALASLIGATLGGAIVLAFGGAFAALGGIIAARSQEVRSAFSDALEDLKPKFKAAAEPMIPVLLHGIELMEQLGNKFVPHFQRALEAAGPHMERFLDNLAIGIEEFGKGAFKPMMDAFNVMMDELGPEFREFFRELGSTFGFLADTVVEYREEVRLAFEIMFELIQYAVALIGGLTKMWGIGAQGIKAVAGALKVAWGWVNRNWNRNVRFAGPGITMVTRWVRTAWGWVNRNWNRNVRFAGPGITMVTRWVRTAWGWVNRNWKRTVRFVGSGIRAVTNAVKTAWNWVNRAWNRVVNFSFTTSGPIGTIRKLLGFAHGGVVGHVGAAATGGVRNNMTLVGEHGPELVNLAPGSHVRSNPDTRRIMRQGGGGGTTQLVFKSSGRRVDDMLLEILREAIKQRGGNPMTVLGG